MTPEEFRAAIAGQRGRKAPRRPKYGNRRTVVDGQTYDSAKEARRMGVLRLLARAGEIRDLRSQVKFPLTVNGTVVAEYWADFVYVRAADGVEVIEDVKSEITRKDKVYRLKAKMMAALGRPITEV